MIELRRLLKNFASAGVMRLVSAILSFLFVPYLGRQWGAEGLGTFSTVLALYLFLEQVPLLGLQLLLIKEVAARPEETGKLATNAMLLSLAVACLVALGLGAFGQTYDPAMRPAIWLVGLSLVPTAPIAVIESVLIGKEKMGRIAGMNVIESLFRVGCWFTIVLLGFGLTSLFAAFLVGRVLLAASYFRWGQVRDFLGLSHASTETVGFLLLACPTFLGIRILSSSINRIDFILLSKLGSIEDVGLYSAPYKLYELCLLVPMLATVVLYPVLSRVLAQSRDQFASLARQIFRIYFVGGMPFAIAIAFHSTAIMHLVYKDEFVGGDDVLAMLSFAVVLAGLDQVCVMIFLAHGRQDLDLRVLAISSALYVALLTAMIPWWGYLGAGIATSLVALVQAGLKIYVAGRWLEVRGMVGVVARPAVAAVLMAGLVWLGGGISPSITVPAAFAFYFAALVIVRAVTPRDWEVLKTAFERRERVEATEFPA